MCYGRSMWGSNSPDVKQLTLTLQQHKVTAREEQQRNRTQTVFIQSMKTLLQHSEYYRRHRSTCFTLSKTNIRTRQKLIQQLKPVRTWSHAAGPSCLQSECSAGARCRSEVMLGDDISGEVIIVLAKFLSFFIKQGRLHGDNQRTSCGEWTQTKHDQFKQTPNSSSSPRGGLPTGITCDSVLSWQDGTIRMLSSLCNFKHVQLNLPTCFLNPVFGQSWSHLSSYPTKWINHISLRLFTWSHKWKKKTVYSISSDVTFRKLVPKQKHLIYRLLPLCESYLHSCSLSTCSTNISAVKHQRFVPAICLLSINSITMVERAYGRKTTKCTTGHTEG